VFLLCGCCCGWHCVCMAENLRTLAAPPRRLHAARLRAAARSPPLLPPLQRCWPLRAQHRCAARSRTAPPTALRRGAGGAVPPAWIRISHRYPTRLPLPRCRGMTITVPLWTDVVRAARSFCLPAAGRRATSSGAAANAVCGCLPYRAAGARAGSSLLSRLGAAGAATRQRTAAEPTCLGDAHRSRRSCALLRCYLPSQRARDVLPWRGWQTLRRLTCPATQHEHSPRAACGRAGA